MYKIEQVYDQAEGDFVYLYYDTKLITEKYQCNECIRNWDYI